MNNDPAIPLQVALYGMDMRTSKTMELYLRGPCQGIAVVVSPAEAQIDIIDADFPTARDILDSRYQQSPDRPIILLSLQEINIPNTFYVKKPVESEPLIAALTQLKILLATEPVVVSQPLISHSLPDTNNALKREVSMDVELPTVVANQTQVDSPSTIVTEHHANSHLTEHAFNASLGSGLELNINDNAALVAASFDAKAYFLAYVRSAYKIAKDQGRVVQLHSVWKPLTIAPQQHQVWLDADDQQIRAIAGLELNKVGGNKVGLHPLTAEEFKQLAADKFQDMDSFIWKLALWTSKGCYLAGLDINRPVYLQHWPNFTRLAVTPEAMRIAALLIQGPRTPVNIAQTLQIKPQYVFVFITACYSLGLLKQAVRQADEIVAPQPLPPTTKQSLLGKILQKLRSGF